MSDLTIGRRDEIELELRELLELCRYQGSTVLDQMMELSRDWPRGWWRWAARRRNLRSWNFLADLHRRVMRLDDSILDLLYELGATQIPAP